ncbi:ketol-acid reductoisomerase, partial [candidate division GN15 bacterium]|nr:ketol-acid reductoisomerase [candidate division GN15 bacterium]
VVCMAFPDHEHGRVFRKDIAPNLQPGTTLWFLHGLSVHFGLVTPPADVDVIMIAPHGPGVAVRDAYLGDRGVSAFYAIHANKSRQARSTVTQLATGIGIKPGKLVKTTFADEAVGDIFGEQAVLCGGLAMLIKTGFDTLVKNGLKPDHAYLEVAYQLDLIIGLIKQHGIAGMFDRISVTARYGSLRAGPKVVTASTKKAMQQVYKEVSSGRFVEQLSKLSDADLKKLRQRLAKLTDPRLERAAKKFAE